MSKAVAHRTVRRFEILLFSLNACFALLLVFYLWHRAWLLAFLMVVLWFISGAIGQALPHRKRQTGAELASGEPVAITDSDLSDEDAFGLAKAIQRTAVMVGVAAFFIAWHDWRWYVGLLAAVAAYVLLFASAAALCYRKPPKTPEQRWPKLSPEAWQRTLTEFKRLQEDEKK